MFMCINFLYVMNNFQVSRDLYIIVYYTMSCVALVLYTCAKDYLVAS